MKQDAYKTEVQTRWGDTAACREYAEKTKTWGQEQWDGAAAGMELIFGEFALCAEKGGSPDGEEARGFVKKLQDYITGHYYTCTKEILAGLGQMYAADERFRKNIDRHGEGTAAFVSKAVACYCQMG